MEKKKWGAVRWTGYEPTTTLYTDFSEADEAGPDAIRKLFTKAFRKGKQDYKYLSELVLVLWWKAREHYEDREKWPVYRDLHFKAWNYCEETLCGEEYDFYAKTYARHIVYV